MQAGNVILVALGANLPSDVGAPVETVRAATDELARKFDGFAASRLFRCPAFPAGSGPDFVNAAARFSSDLPPGEVLDILHDVEARLGRRRGVRWASRVIDLDLIAHGQTVQPDLETQTAWRALTLDQQMTQTPDRLILPHPRLQDRGFVLKPLADVAPEWIHPILGTSVAQMLDALPAQDTEDVVPL